MYTLEPDIWSTALLNKLELQNLEAIRTNYPTRVDISEVKKALAFAKTHHGDQKRNSGEPYYSHPITVANYISSYCFKTDAIVTSILHDLLEDTEVTQEMLVRKFSLNIANQVENLTRIKIDRKWSSKEIVGFLYLQNDKDLLLVKLFDRLHNIHTIHAKSPEKRKKIILETLLDFLPLAAYFSLFDIEEDLYKICTSFIPEYLDQSKTYFYRYFCMSVLDSQNDEALSHNLY